MGGEGTQQNKKATGGDNDRTTNDGESVQFDALSNSGK
jgi:hypothetical protein